MKSSSKWGPLILGHLALLVTLACLDRSHYDIATHTSVDNLVPRWLLWVLVVALHLALVKRASPPDTRHHDKRLLFGMLAASLCLWILPISVRYWAVYALTLAVAATWLRLGRASNWRPSKRTCLLGIGTVALVFLLGTFLHQVLMYLQFTLGYSDTGIYYDRLTTIFSGGSFHQINSDLAPYEKHFGPGLLVLAPILWLWRSPVALMLIQSAGFVAAALAVAWVCRKRGLSWPVSAAMCAAFLVSPAVSQGPYAYSFGFHAPTAALPFFVLAWHWLDREQWRLGVPAALAACLMQEHIAIYFFGLATAWVLTAGKRRVGAVLGVLSLLYVYLAFRVFIPQGSGQMSGGMVLWAHLGRTTGEILLSPFLRPSVWWDQLMRGTTLHHLLELLIPVAVLAWHRPRLCLALWPAVLFNVLRTDEVATCMALQYSTLSIGCVWIAAVAAMTDLPVGQRRGYAIALVAGCLVCGLFMGNNPVARRTVLHKRPLAPLAESAEVFQRIRDLVPKSASVTADERTMLLFVNHRYARRARFASHETDFLVFQRGARHRPPEKVDQEVAARCATGNWQVILDQAGVVVVQRTTPAQPIAEAEF